jgi:hypothetical protein
MKKVLFPILGTIVAGMCIAGVVQADDMRGGTVKGRGEQPQEATTVKSSKSNSSERLGGTGGVSTPAKTSNLNLSKSNLNRTAPPVQEPAEGIDLNPKRHPLSKPN